jgi:hypothetical protein
MYASTHQKWPHTAKPVVYQPLTYSKNPLAQCARLTDSGGITGGLNQKSATVVTKIREVNKPPARPKCVPSHKYKYELQFAGVDCPGGAEYVYSGLAKAAPNDTAGAVATASLDFRLKC